MKTDFAVKFGDWLRAAGLSERAVSDYKSNVRRVQRRYGDLDDLFDKDGLAGVQQALQDAQNDAKLGRANRSGIEVDGDLGGVLSSLKTAVSKYAKFRESRGQTRGEPERWDDYLGEAKRKLDSHKLDQEEAYKDDLARAVSEAREAMLSGSGNWSELLKGTLRHPRNNLVFWRNQNKVVEWIDASTEDVPAMIAEFWAVDEDGVTPGDRVRAFDRKLPTDLLGKGASTRLDPISYLMMGLDGDLYPPIRLTRFQKTYKRLGYPQPSTDDLGAHYEHALAFLDDLQAEAKRRGMDRPATRLEAQSVVWSLSDDSTEVNDSAEPYLPTDSPHGLNTILYGPPGTGKTFATTERCVQICDGMASDTPEDLRARYDELTQKGRVEFVTFHQSFGYEEFVEGLRPAPGTAGIGLKVETGVLRRIAEQARMDRGRPHVLVIDEINRANVSKVLGELITLLEEDKREGAENEVAVTLPYSKESFTLPANLHILGTMNTADRSIALLDTALRRRFDFEEMSPDPDLLKEAVERTGVDLPVVLRAMNQRLEYLVDRDHLIGHAWFMNAGSREDVDGAMRRKIIPLIAEYFYDDWNKVNAVLGGTEHFVERRRLARPPGLDGDFDEERYQWTVREPFPEDAYEALLNGSAAADQGE